MGVCLLIFLIVAPVIQSGAVLERIRSGKDNAGNPVRNSALYRDGIFP